MTEATPRPWRVGHDDGSGLECVGTVAKESTKPHALPARSVARVTWGCGCCENKADPEDYANAALIVRAVNAHEALVLACSETLEALEVNADVWPPGLFAPWIKQLRDAIELAKGS